MQYHVNGELRDRTEATVPVTDRGFRYGDAAIETVRIDDGTPFQWTAHAERLLETCTTIGIDAGMDTEDLADRVDATITANDVRHGVVTMSISRGQHPDPDPVPTGVEPTVVLTVDPDDPPGADRSPATLQTVRTRRIPPDCLPGIDTTHNRLNTVLACRELQTMSRETPADDALMRNIDDEVVGTALAALFVVTEDGLHSPAPAGPDAPAIAREVVRDLASGEDIPVDTDSIDREMVHGAEEVFLANTRWGIRPVETVDGISVATGSVTELLAARYRHRIDTADW